ncbi:MAG: hypothetical protein ABI355_02235 [Solirubrobacteraceae bacterium]
MSSTPYVSGRVSEEDHERARAGFGGGPDGNEQLTAATGVVLIVLLAALGVTILLIGQLTWLHFFLGLLLIGPVALKLASTGYRFTRYYTHSPAYRRRGTPETWLRLLAPLVILSTVVVFVSGVVLMYDGPAHRDPVLLIHKASFFVWVGATALHVLGHLLGLPAALRAASLDRGSPRGGGQTGGIGRAIALIGAIVGGLVLAIALIPDFSIWTAHLSLIDHHHR